MKNLLAFDLGASNGRAILGRLEGDRLTLHELHRFENRSLREGELLTWNLPHLYEQLLCGFRAFASTRNGDLDCFGIDGWGVDYGLLDASGKVLECPRSYRIAQPEDCSQVWETVRPEALFASGGINSRNATNTLYQLCRRQRENDPSLANAQTLLLLPDLLGFLLTGQIAAEYTNATTTMLCNPNTHDWAWETIEALNLPRRIFPRIDRAGRLRGKLRQSVAESTGINRAPFAAVGTHDTASAVAAIPAESEFAFCSSGTWSIFGTETGSPILSSAMYRSGFSNEGTVQGAFCPLRNIMGLWLIQECRHRWQNDGLRLSWDEIVAEAHKAPALRSIIDPDAKEFFNTPDMPQAIRYYCRSVGQPEPETIGQTARCIYESLALKYRWAMEQLEMLCGRKFDRLHIVGGGCSNNLLNQFVADSIDRTVLTGPAEAAAIGNLLMQAMALGEVHDIMHLRRVVRNSFEVKQWNAQHTPDWDKAYDCLCAQMKEREKHERI